MISAREHLLDNPNLHNRCRLLSSWINTLSPSLRLEAWLLWDICAEHSCERYSFCDIRQKLFTSCLQCSHFLVTFCNAGLRITAVPVDIIATNRLPVKKYAGVSGCRSDPNPCRCELAITPILIFFTMWSLSRRYLSPCSFSLLSRPLRSLPVRSLRSRSLLNDSHSYDLGHGGDARFCLYGPRHSSPHLSLGVPRPWFGCCEDAELCFHGKVASYRPLIFNTCIRLKLFCISWISPFEFWKHLRFRCCRNSQNCLRVMSASSCLQVFFFSMQTVLFTSLKSDVMSLLDPEMSNRT